MTAKTKAHLRLELDPELHRSLKIAATEQGTTVQAIAMAALRDWLRRKENEEDASAIAEVEHDEFVPLNWDRYRADLELAETEES